MRAAWSLVLLVTVGWLAGGCAAQDASAPAAENYVSAVLRVEGMT